MSRALPSLAHALSVAPDLNASLIAMGEALMDGDRSAVLALLRYDGRKEMLRERLTPSGGQVESATVDTTFDHLPPNVRVLIAGGGQFVDLGERSVEYARLFGLTPFADGGLLSLRGLTTDGQLAAVLALYEQRKMFGTRTSERFASSAALFDLAYARFADREARDEAVNTLEAVTQKVHGDYLTQLGELQTELTRTQEMATSGDHVATDRVQLEQELRTAEENARRANHRANATEQQLMAAVGQLEQAHVELHRVTRHFDRKPVRSIYWKGRLPSTTPPVIRLHWWTACWPWSAMTCRHSDAP
jgi:hypothetical protein